MTIARTSLTIALIAVCGCAGSKAESANPASPAALAATANATNKGNFAAPPTFAASGVLITAEEVTFKDHHLRFRLTVTNQTPGTLTINRNEMALALPDGRVLARENAAFGGWGWVPTEAVHTLPAGTSHALHVDFRTEGRPPEAKLRLTGFAVNGQPVPLPEYLVAGR